MAGRSRQGQGGGVRRQVRPVNRVQPDTAIDEIYKKQLAKIAPLEENSSDAQIILKAMGLTCRIALVVIKYAAITAKRRYIREENDTRDLLPDVKTIPPLSTWAIAQIRRSTGIWGSGVRVEELDPPAASDQDNAAAQRMEQFTQNMFLQEWDDQINTSQMPGLDENTVKLSLRFLTIVYSDMVRQMPIIGMVFSLKNFEIRSSFSKINAEKLQRMREEIKPYALSLKQCLDNGRSRQVTTELRDSGLGGVEGGAAGNVLEWARRGAVPEYRRLPGEGLPAFVERMRIVKERREAERTAAGLYDWDTFTKNSRFTDPIVTVVHNLVRARAGWFQNSEAEVVALRTALAELQRSVIADWKREFESAVSLQRERGKIIPADEIILREIAFHQAVADQIQVDETTDPWRWRTFVARVKNAAQQAGSSILDVAVALNMESVHGARKIGEEFLGTTSLRSVTVQSPSGKLSFSVRRRASDDELQADEDAILAEFQTEIRRQFKEIKEKIEADNLEYAERLRALVEAGKGVTDTAQEAALTIVRILDGPMWTPVRLLLNSLLQNRGIHETAVAMLEKVQSLGKNVSTGATFWSSFLGTKFNEADITNNPPWFVQFSNPLFVDSEGQQMLVDNTSEGRVSHDYQDVVVYKKEFKNTAGGNEEPIDSYYSKIHGWIAVSSDDFYTLDDVKFKLVWQDLYTGYGADKFPGMSVYVRRMTRMTDFHVGYACPPWFTSSEYFSKRQYIKHGTANSLRLASRSFSVASVGQPHIDFAKPQLERFRGLHNSATGAYTKNKPWKVSADTTAHSVHQDWQDKNVVFFVFRIVSGVYKDGKSTTELKDHREEFIIDLGRVRCSMRMDDTYGALDFYIKVASDTDTPCAIRYIALKTAASLASAVAKFWTELAKNGSLPNNVLTEYSPDREYSSTGQLKEWGHGADSEFKNGWLGIENSFANSIMLVEKAEETMLGGAAKSSVSGSVSTIVTKTALKVLFDSALLVGLGIPVDWTSIAITSVGLQTTVGYALSYVFDMIGKKISENYVMDDYTVAALQASFSRFAAVTAVRAGQVVVGGIGTGSALTAVLYDFLFSATLFIVQRVVVPKLQGQLRGGPVREGIIEFLFQAALGGMGIVAGVMRWFRSKVGFGYLSVVFDPIIAAYESARNSRETIVVCAVFGGLISWGLVQSGAAPELLTVVSDVSAGIMPRVFDALTLNRFNFQGNQLLTGRGQHGKIADEILGLSALLKEKLAGALTTNGLAALSTAWMTAMIITFGETTGIMMTLLSLADSIMFRIPDLRPSFNEVKALQTDGFAEKLAARVTGIPGAANVVEDVNIDAVSGFNGSLRNLNQTAFGNVIVENIKDNIKDIPVLRDRIEKRCGPMYSVVNGYHEIDDLKLNMVVRQLLTNTEATSDTAFKLFKAFDKITDEELTTWCSAPIGNLVDTGSIPGVDEDSNLPLGYDAYVRAVGFGVPILAPNVQELTERKDVWEKIAGLADKEHFKDFIAKMFTYPGVITTYVAKGLLGNYEKDLPDQVIREKQAKLIPTIIDVSAESLATFFRTKSGKYGLYVKTATALRDRYIGAMGQKSVFNYLSKMAEDTQARFTKSDLNVFDNKITIGEGVQWLLTGGTAYNVVNHLGFVGFAAGRAFSGIVGVTRWLYRGVTNNAKTTAHYSAGVTGEKETLAEGKQPSKLQLPPLQEQLADKAQRQRAALLESALNKLVVVDVSTNTIEGMTNLFYVATLLENPLAMPDDLEWLLEIFVSPADLPVVDDPESHDARELQKLRAFLEQAAAVVNSTEIEECYSRQNFSFCSFLANTSQDEVDAVLQLAEPGVDAKILKPLVTPERKMAFLRLLALTRVIADLGEIGVLVSPDEAQKKQQQEQQEQQEEKEEEEGDVNMRG